jgi:hypothetical protein
MLRASREDVINYLVAVCVKNGVTPFDVRFAGFIQKACAAKFGYDRQKAKSFIDALISAWRFDRWRSFVEESPYLTSGEKMVWMEKHGV